MAIGKLMAKAASGAVIFLIAVAPAALAKTKDSGNYSVGCLTQDTALQAAEGLATGTAAATVTIEPASLWPPNHKMRTEDITMTLPAAASSAVDVSLQVTDITDDQVTDDNGKGGGCGKPTSRQGEDWSPTVFPGAVSAGPLQFTTDSLALDGVELRSERCARSGTRTYMVTVQCCDTTYGVCDTVGTLNGIALESLPELDVTVLKSRRAH